MNSDLPLLLRILIFGERLTFALTRCERAFREEILWAAYGPKERHRITIALYSRLKPYSPVGKIFSRGLFEWEKWVLASPSFPRNGRILVGACGTGRELFPLLDRGYEVVAFSPDDPPVELARQALRDNKRAEILVASYADFVRFAEEGSGPLSPSKNIRSIDAVILGWSSFSHITTADDRGRLMQGLRRLYPKAPVLLSFFGPEPLPPGRIDRAIRRTLRAFFRTLGFQSIAGEGDGYLGGGGFLHRFTPAEMGFLAQQWGYRIEMMDFSLFPYAFLIPND